MKNLLLNKKVMAAVAVASCMAASAVSAYADPFTTLAQFKVDDASLADNNGFIFNNSGSTSSLTNVGSSVLVDFAYQVTSNTYNGSVGVDIPAQMTLTSQVSSTAVTAGGSDFQPLTDVVLTITALNAKGGKSNLMTLTFTPAGGPSTGLTYGPNNPNVTAANFDGDNKDFAGDKVYLTSDFLALNDPVTGASLADHESFSLDFTNLTPGLTIAGNNYLSPFTADGAGQFGADAGTGQNKVPEPASLMTLGLGAVGLLVRRRNTKA